MRFGWAWATFALAALGGCSSADHPEPISTASGDETLCEGWCTGLRRCDSAARNCESTCVTDPASLPRGLREDAVEPLGQCMSQESCETLGGDYPWSACIDSVAASLPLTQALVDYCESAALNYFECGIWWSVDDCAAQMSLLADVVLSNARTCHERTCEQILGCEAVVFGSN